MKKIYALMAFALLATEVKAQFRTQAQQQILTNEDSLHNGVAKAKTVLSGYGSAYYQHNTNNKTTTASLERAVLFIGHRFSSKIAFFSEIEIENALVSGAEQKGEMAMEQAFLKFNLNQSQYIVAGLFIPRIGLLNENHLPVNFNGVERPMVETWVIPATWRELGIGFYGSVNNMPLNYSVALMNGLNSADFQHGTGIRDGRAEGSFATANNMAVTAALQYSIPRVKFQVSGYAGGTVGLSGRGADSLKLESGPLGTPVYLGEANAQYNHHGITGRVLAAYISYPDAAKVNVAYGKNLPSAVYGAYAELGYDWLYHRHGQSQFITFARYEKMDLNAKIPAAPEGIIDPTLNQSHLIAGFNYLPLPNVCIKMDVRLMHTGNQNPALVVNPAPNALPYKPDNSFINLGIGYSF
ncbi:MAG: hypothetical protein QM743_00545 [Chitinophagaceae bacterium]